METFDEALWSGNMDRLQELAPCACCCHEHTFTGCPARLWGGCRSGLAPGAISVESDVAGWAEFYGWTVERFLNEERPRR